MIIVDTGILVAAGNLADPAHEAAARAVSAERGPLVLSPFVLAEARHLIVRAGREAELTLLADVALGAYELAPFTAADVGRAREIIEDEADVGMGLVDASIVVLAQRFKTRRLLTLDRRFAGIRPLQGGRFSILPA